MKSNFSEVLILFQNGKLNEAKNICEEILKQETNNSEAYNLYAFVLYSLKEFDVAIEYWNKATKIKFHKICNIYFYFIIIERY